MNPASFILSPGSARPVSFFKKFFVGILLSVLTLQIALGSSVVWAAEEAALSHHPFDIPSDTAKSPETLVLNPKPIFHIALTPREAEQYRISQLRDYANAAYNRNNEIEAVKWEEFYSDGFRIFALWHAFSFLFRGANAFASSRIGNFLYQKSARVLGVPGTGTLVKVIGLTSVAILVPLFVYQTFTTDPNYEGSLFTLSLWGVGLFDLGGVSGTISQLTGPFEFELLGSAILVDQRHEATSFIGRKFKEFFGLDYPSKAKIFYRAVNRVRLHADKSCRVFGGNKASVDIMRARLYAQKLTQENFDNGEVWLNGKPISYLEATFHHFSLDEDYYLFKEPFYCHRGIFRSEVSINDLIDNTAGSAKSGTRGRSAGSH